MTLLLTGIMLLPADVHAQRAIPDGGCLINDTVYGPGPDCDAAAEAASAKARADRARRDRLLREKHERYLEELEERGRRHQAELDDPDLQYVVPDACAGSDCVGTAEAAEARARVQRQHWAAIEEGEAALARGDRAAAREAFRRAQSLKPSPETQRTLNALDVGAAVERAARSLIDTIVPEYDNADFANDLREEFGPPTGPRTVSSNELRGIERRVAAAVPQWYEERDQLLQFQFDLLSPLLHPMADIPRYSGMPSISRLRQQHVRLSPSAAMRAVPDRESISAYDTLHVTVLKFDDPEKYGGDGYIRGRINWMTTMMSAGASLSSEPNKNQQPFAFESPHMNMGYLKSPVRLPLIDVYDAHRAGLDVDSLLLEMIRPDEGTASSLYFTPEDNPRGERLSPTALMQGWQADNTIVVASTRRPEMDDLYSLIRQPDYSEQYEQWSEWKRTHRAESWGFGAYKYPFYGSTAFGRALRSIVHIGTDGWRDRMRTSLKTNQMKDIACNETASSEGLSECLKQMVPLAERGAAAAQAHLATLYDDLSESPLYLAEAVRWAQHAAQQGEPLALARMAAYTFFGRGIEEDEGQADAWIERMRPLGPEDRQQLAYLFRVLSEDASRNGNAQLSRAGRAKIAEFSAP